MWNIFKKQPKYSVCKECGNVFESVAGYEDKYAELCKFHRIPVMEIDRRKENVMAWARYNWERLEKIKNEESKYSQESYNRALTSAYQSQKSALEAQTGLGSLGWHEQSIFGVNNGISK